MWCICGLIDRLTGDYLLCTAKLKDQKLNRTPRVAEDVLTESLTSGQLEKTSKTKPDTDTNDDDIFADIFSLSSKTKSNVVTKSNTGVNKASPVSAGDDIFAGGPPAATAAVKTTKPAVLSNKASAAKNTFNIDDDDDDDIFAVKPSSVSTSNARNSAVDVGSSTKKVCYFD